MYCDFACFTAITHFVANCVKFCKNAMLGGLPDLLQYYMYYVIYEQPPMSDKRPIILTNVSTQIFVKMKRGEFRH